MNAQRKTNLDELENAIEYKFKNIIHHMRMNLSAVTKAMKDLNF